MKKNKGKLMKDIEIAKKSDPKSRIKYVNNFIDDYYEIWNWGV